jgi:hypothetical protein
VAPVTLGDGSYTAARVRDENEEGPA